jgi:hypothetical protein
MSLSHWLSMRFLILTVSLPKIFAIAKKKVVFTVLAVLVTA